MTASVRDAIGAAWQLVCGDYQAGAIKSERTMLACFYKHLTGNSNFGARVYCEPGMQLKSARAIPDMVITSGDRIVAAIELKFVPHHYAKFEDDVAKLGDYAEHGRERASTWIPRPARSPSGGTRSRATSCSCSRSSRTRTPRRSTRPACGRGRARVSGSCSPPTAGASCRRRPADWDLASCASATGAPRAAARGGRAAARCATYQREDVIGTMAVVTKRGPLF